MRNDGSAITVEGYASFILESAKLDGVDDIVILPADHTTIAFSRDGRSPLAWDVIADRLSR